MLYVIIFNHHKSAKNMQNLVNKLQFYHYGNLICFDILVIDMHTSCMSNNVYNQKKKQKETIQKSRLYLSCNAKVENCTIVQIWRVFSHKIKKKNITKINNEIIHWSFWYCKFGLKLKNDPYSQKNRDETKHSYALEGSI